MSRDALVSCLMPTSGRRAFVPLAIDCFLRQDHRHRELIVIDDGDDPVADLIPDHPAISYERLHRRLTLGAKRNLACRRAAGDVLLHWDDDDWSAPWRISYQLRDLREARADVAGLRALYFMRAAPGPAWRYAYPEGAGRPWVAGGTLCYTRAAWSANPFPELDVGEDTRFVWAAARGLRVHAHADDRFYVATVHARNTSIKRPVGRRWTEVPAADVEALMGEDAAAYRAAAAGRPHVARARPEETHVTVSVPYFRCRRQLRRCVESLMAQTHQDLTVVVVNDGDPEPPWDLLADLDDPRLVRFDLGANRGRYYADQVVLEATRSRWLLVHDADDWSEPTRVEVLLRRLRESGAVLALSAAQRHADDGRPVGVAALARPQDRLGPRLEHRAYMVGLHDVAALRAVGGLYAGFRVGYDTFLGNALAMTGEIVHEPAPLYHIARRPDSLTRAPETGPYSTLRGWTRRELRKMYAEAYGAYAGRPAGATADETLAASIRRLVGARVSRAAAQEIEAHAARLAPLLHPARAGQAPRPAVPALPWGDRTITPALARALEERLTTRAPRRILEVGSGVSTVILAEHAARTGTTVVALEHEERFAARTRALLASRGLQDAVDVRVASLRPRHAPDGRADRWYAVDLDGTFDFVFVDGPPLSAGRGAVLFGLREHLATDWELWLHDAARAHERDCLARWRAHVAFETTERRLDARGLAILRPPAHRRRGAMPARRSPHLVFWSKLDLRYGGARPSDAWVEQRFRYWLAYTLPSVLAQRRDDFEYWLICDPAARARTESLAACLRDERVHLVYADDCARRLAALPASDRYVLARIDSDDLYAPGVAEAVSGAGRAPFVQFNRGYACDVRTGELRHWRSRSSPFYAHRYGPELRSRRWSEPDHTRLPGRAEPGADGSFLVTLHGHNDSSSVRMALEPVAAADARAVLGRFGLGTTRDLGALAVTARGNAGWPRRSPPPTLAEIHAAYLRRLPPGGLAPPLETAAMLMHLCELVLPRRILDIGAGIGALCAAAHGAGHPGVARRSVAADREALDGSLAQLSRLGLPPGEQDLLPAAAPVGPRTPRYDLVIHAPADATRAAEGLELAIASLDPTGLLVWVAPSEAPSWREVERRLSSLCADRHLDTEARGPDDTRFRSVVVGRVIRGVA